MYREKFWHNSQNGAWMKGPLRTVWYMSLDPKILVVLSEQSKCNYGKGFWTSFWNESSSDQGLGKSEWWEPNFRSLDGGEEMWGYTVGFSELPLFLLMTWMFHASWEILLSIYFFLYLEWISGVLKVYSSHSFKILNHNLWTQACDIFT